MSTPELPDDPRDWPDDPFVLFGVPRGAGEMEIKRAYTRLIRRFKPEHSPEQFRRIREAYEMCLEEGRWFFRAADFSAPDFERPPATPTTEIPSADVPSEASPLPEPTPTPHAPVVDEVDRLWEAAAEGRDGEAYAGLAELAAARPDRPDLPLRLYWLLALNPALDPARTRHDWLADALGRSRLSGPAAELYRRELEVNSEAALYGPYLRLLSSPAHPQDALTVARWRLTAAGRTRSWHPIGIDLEALSKHLPYHDESAWLGYVVTVSDWSAWEHPQPLHSRTAEELGRLQHMELSHAYAFDRVEETAHLAAEWRVALGWSGLEDLFRLMPIAWVGSSEVTAAEIGTAVAPVAEDPGGSIYRLDRVVRERGGGQIILLIRILDRFLRNRDRDETEFPPELIRGLAHGQSAVWRRHYNEFRHDLLNFLTAEAIHPEEFVAACSSSPDFRVRGVAESLREDVSLHLVWLADRLHRG